MKSQHFQYTYFFAVGRKGEGGSMNRVKVYWFYCIFHKSLNTNKFSNKTDRHTLFVFIVLIQK